MFLEYDSVREPPEPLRVHAGPLPFKSCVKIAKISPARSSLSRCSVLGRSSAISRFLWNRQCGWDAIQVCHSAYQRIFIHFCRTAASVPMSKHMPSLSSEDPDWAVLSCLDSNSNWCATRWRWLLLNWNHHDLLFVGNKTKSCRLRSLSFPTTWLYMQHCRYLTKKFFGFFF